MRMSDISWRSSFLVFPFFFYLFNNLHLRYILRGHGEFRAEGKNRFSLRGKGVFLELEDWVLYH